MVTSDQVSGTLRSVDGVDGIDGKALCLDYDFNGVSGYAGITRELPLDYPDNYAFSFQLRGDSPANDLQFKLVDDSGDNVWWVNRPRYAFPPQWTPVQLQAPAHHPRLGAGAGSDVAPQPPDRVHDLQQRRRQGLGLLRPAEPARDCRRRTIRR